MHYIEYQNISAILRSDYLNKNFIIKIIMKFKIFVISKIMIYPNTLAIVLPISAGEATTLIPHSSMICIFA